MCIFMEVFFCRVSLGVGFNVSLSVGGGSRGNCCGELEEWVCIWMLVGVVVWWGDKRGWGGGWF